MSARRSAARCRRGVAAIEFALIGGLFLLALLAAIDVGRYYMTLQGLRNFAADATRYGIVNIWWGDTAGTQSATCAQVVAATGRGGAIGGLVSTSPGNCVTRTQTTTGGALTVTVDVNIDVQFTFVINAFGILSPRYQESTSITFQL
ncbi:TadE/TadG family type IV pilus assembly protein [Neoroseomonas soli]|uniref:TadE-like domain-containing protein n=1 Tax=Neoroseomonas soli TaxID=1081025 RepID=A0A9X9X0S9_9PROT|nr:hypothetical protein [Neoroseomonas soli]